MTISLNQFHDAELIGLSHDPASATVCLLFRLENEFEAEILFQGVCGLRVDGFSLQNIVFDLLSSCSSQFTHEEIILHLTWIHGVDDASEVAQFVDLIKHGELLLVVAVPSCGAEFAILAKTHTILVPPKKR